MSAPRGATEGTRLVNRLKNTNPEKFRTMCMMHLSFLLDLPGASLDEFLNTQGTDKNKKHPFFTKKLKPNRESCLEAGIIGAPLSIEAIRHIDPLFQFLGRPENLQQEGLFRKSGQLQRQKFLREKLNSTDDIGVELASGAYSAHDVANLLKAFLGELPEPILTDKHYPAYCQVPEMVQKGLNKNSVRARSLIVGPRTDMVCSDMEAELLRLREARQLQTIQLLFQLLPRENLLLLESLLDLLHRVTCVEDNKMTADTLGMLFAPCILVPRKMSGNELQSITGNIIRATSFMIEKAPELFTIPEPLVRDIANYWEEMEEGTENRPGSASSSSSCDEIDSCRHSRIRRRLDPPCDVVNTTVTFVDRAVAAEAAAQTDTQVALAQLYAHVSSMPESSKKRKLLKQFNKANGAGTPTNSVSKHKRTLSLGESLKKMVSRNHKRRGSGHAVQVHSVMSVDSCPEPPAVVSQHTPIIKRPHSSCGSPALSTPVMRLFRDNMQQPLLPSSPLVHIVDMKEEGTTAPILRQERKRKLHTDTQSMPPESFPFSTPKMPKKHLKHNIENAENIPHFALLRPKKSPSASPVVVTPDRRFEKPTATLR